jgi:hypothetical protein
MMTFSNSRLRKLRLALRASLVMLVSMLVLHTVFSKLKASATSRIDSLTIPKNNVNDARGHQHEFAKPALTFL